MENLRNKSHQAFSRTRLRVLTRHVGPVDYCQRRGTVSWFTRLSIVDSRRFPSTSVDFRRCPSMFVDFRRSPSSSVDFDVFTRAPEGLQNRSPTRVAKLAQNRRIFDLRPRFCSIFRAEHGSEGPEVRRCSSIVFYFSFV